MTYRIGVVGYSGQNFDKRLAEALLAEALVRAVAHVPLTADIEVVSGLTDLGVPAIAYKLATLYGWKTAGVACAKARDYPCFPCHREEIVGDDWGDESATFLGQIDCLVRVGGGAQSIAETAKAKRLGRLVIEKELPAIE